MTLPRFLFIGGSGRSGTSFVTRSIGAHPQIASLDGVELKFFASYGGLIDLSATLTRHYSPSRALEAMAHFSRIFDMLISGGFGQRPLAGTAAGARLVEGHDRFRAALMNDGVPRRLDEADFMRQAATLVEALAAAAVADRAPGAAQTEPSVIVEKTPHNLLFADFLSRLAPGAAFLHISRDPRAVACSLAAMRWGPDTLAGAAEWITAYSDAWRAAAARHRALGLPVRDLFIEDLVADPATHAAAICQDLGLRPAPGMFDRVNARALDHRLDALDAAERALLHARLDDLAVSLGYAPDTIGQRCQPATRSGGVIAMAAP